MGWLVFVEEGEVDWVADSLRLLVVWMMRSLHALSALRNSVRIEM
jgi:hypothetical protein